MTGTEKIKTKILEDARVKADQIQEQALQEIHAIKASAKAEGERRRADILKKAEADGQEAYRRILSVAGLEARKEVLGTKQDRVNEAFQQALEKITQLPDRDYQKLLEDMVVLVSAKGSGDLLLSEKDMHRTDKQFIQNINKRLKASGSDGNLTLAKENIKTAGGFILRHGDMEINNTLEILFDMARPELENEVVKILFS